MFDHPEDPSWWNVWDEYLLGDALLVAPVVEPGLTRRTVYLPNGPAAWYDFHTGEKLEAGREHTVAAPLATLPLFARHGAQIPIAAGVPGRQRHDDPVSGVRTFGA